jgi:hypothetical protein
MGEVGALKLKIRDKHNIGYWSIIPYFRNLGLGGDKDVEAAIRAILAGFSL